MSFQPSQYQTSIFDFVENGRGDGLVNAVAGSGKTKTLTESAKLIRSSSARFVAFSKTIADEIAFKLEDTPMQAKTVHSIGMGAVTKELGRVNVNDKKYEYIARDWVDARYPGIKGNYERTRTLELLAKFARLNLVDPSNTEALQDIADHYDLDSAEDVMHGVQPVIDAGIMDATEKCRIDFTDMIYLVSRLNLTPPKMEWVFVDECQDISRAALDVVLRSRAYGGRMLLVGDEKQAIMGFAGGDAYSYQNIVDKLSPTQLPLSICYRCPQSHLRLARSIVPYIEARENAPEGEIKHVANHDAINAAREGDLMIARRNVTLLEMCFSLISKRIPAKIKGRDIGQGLVNIVRRVSEFPGFEYKQFSRFLAAYFDQQAARLSGQKRAEAKIQRLADRVDSVLVCYENFKDCTSAEQLAAEIGALFSDGRASVWLSTVHRAKGLEAERVFILKPDELPLTWKGQLPWEYEQEVNLTYVAFTRATQSLFFVK